MIIPTFIGSVALGGLAGISSVVAAVIARRATKEADEMRRLIPQWNELRDVESQILSAKAELVRLDAKRVELSAGVQRSEELSAKIPGLERHIAELEAKKESLLPMEAEYQRLSILHSQKKLELDQLQQDRIALERQLEEAKAATDRERKIADEQRATAAAAKAEAEIARQQRDAFAAEADGLQKRIAGLEAKASELQSDIARLSAQESGLRTEVMQHERALAEVRERIAEARATQAALESRLVELARQEEQLRETLSGLEEEIRGLTSELASLRAEREGLRTEIDELKRRIAELQKEKARISSDSDALARDLAGMRASAAGSKFTLLEATNDLFSPYITHERDAGDFGSEEGALEMVAEHATALGFQYPDRVLRAFHTSLKLGRQAPLLVLAGISGTGKSQLPRLYCDALGINFLPMAVQPGWDSPADLVGFFSHIEHRFKPTVLARALVQMDGYFEESMSVLTRKELDKFLERRDAREDGMLLVLLDEMNLARVEYYFSDFLSRLELRNASGFDAADPEKRKRVELVLDTPGAEGALKHISVFPGDNVLFVGTMNEDESTMALSDKVIDRANVLRFGKPEVLKAETGGEVDPCEYYLTREQWRNWTSTTVASSADAKRVSQIAKWTEQLNGALDAVQRAFAHRTAAAIKAYCLAYPPGTLKSDAALRNAFADQIEQRVMPKLRGVDPSTPDGQRAMQGLRELIGELGDGELEDAFIRGRDANDGQSFVWYGARRKV
jgi:predicted  nucleic acid-binding Zn-ribbon protein